LLALPLVRAALDLLDFLVFEALLQVLLPQFVSNSEVIILGEPIVPEVLSVSIVPNEHFLHTGGLFLPETLFAAKFRLELRVVLLNQVELNNRLLILVIVREGGGGFSEIVKVLGMCHRHILRH